MLLRHRKAELRPRRFGSQRNVDIIKRPFGQKLQGRLSLSGIELYLTNILIITGGSTANFYPIGWPMTRYIA